MSTRTRTTVLSIVAGALTATLGLGAPGRAAQPSPTPSPTPTTVPAGFVLGDPAAGWQQGRRRALAKLVVCAQPIWSLKRPRVATDRLGAELSGGETSLQRTLVLYAGERAAQRTLATVVTQVRACAVQSAALSPRPVEISADTVGYVERPGQAGGTGPGFAVVVTRVGNALVIERDYLDRTGGRVVGAAFDRIHDDLAPVLEQVAAFTTGG